MRWGAPAPQGGGSTATAGVTAEAADMRAERVVNSSASRTSFLIRAMQKPRQPTSVRPQVEASGTSGRPQARPSACAVRFFVKRGRGHTATPYRYRYITARVCPLSCEFAQDCDSAGLHRLRFPYRFKIGACGCRNENFACRSYWAFEHSGLNFDQRL